MLAGSKHHIGSGNIDGQSQAQKFARTGENDKDEGDRVDGSLFQAGTANLYHALASEYESMQKDPQCATG